MDKKIALVTGASKGIGLATAKLLYHNGYTVYGGARNSFTEEGITAVTLDVTKPESVKQAVDFVIGREGRLDVLINNAGMGISGPVETTDEADAKYIFDVNFFGAFYMVKAALPYLRKSRGRIINTSSVASYLSIPFQSFYSSTKAALDALAFALVSEVKPFGIKVTNILPGDTRTNFTDARRKGVEEKNGVYGERVARSVAVMENDERHGMPPEKTAKTVLKTLKKRNPPVIKAVGLQYKLFLFLNKILPKKFVIWVIGKIYG